MSIHIQDLQNYKDAKDKIERGIAVDIHNKMRKGADIKDFCVDCYFGIPHTNYTVHTISLFGVIQYCL